MEAGSGMQKILYMWRNYGSQQITKLSSEYYEHACFVLPHMDEQKRFNAFENRCYWKILRVSWTEHRTNQSIVDEPVVTSGTLLNLIKKSKIMLFWTHKKTPNAGVINTRKKS